MATTNPANTPQRRVSKSSLSLFLRTRCDRELFLSIQDKKTMGSLGLPPPVKRPGVGTLSHEGIEFEVQRNDQLVRLFGSSISYRKGQKEYGVLDLCTALNGINSLPHLILQGRFSIAPQKTQTLKNIGLSAAQIAVIPDIADFAPDVLVIRRPKTGDVCINANGSKTPINDATESRLAIDIFDIKHTAEANPSYCSEIAMYALMLSNWLSHDPSLSARYYVSMESYLWTRYKQGDSKLDSMERSGVVNTDLLLHGLITDSEDASLRFYLPAIRRFFEDVARVIQSADAGDSAWRHLDWHVGSACAGCDWLGDKRHISSVDKLHVNAHPNDYCLSAASIQGHLCMVPGITRGAKKVLRQNEVPDTSTLASSTGHSVFQQHTVLKRDAKTLPVRSQAILSGALANDNTAAIASMVKSANLLIYASVNFDSSSGLLTGLALGGIASSFAAGQAPRRFTTTPYLVDKKSLSEEWVAIEGFLTQIAEWIRITETMANGNNITGQIHFWEDRQFQELCNAVGRHLPRVMALADRKARAMSWIFPPDELLVRPEALEAATIVTLEDIVRRMVFTPTAHVITLFDTAEHYPGGPVQTVRDSYYREYLSNGIPRERIYEIWSGQPMIKRGSSRLPRNTVISEYSEALKKQSQALESIANRLRSDYSSNIKAKATYLPSTNIAGAVNVAFDSKLWIWWDKLDFHASQLEAHMRCAMDGDRLEASYEAIVLNNGTLISPGIYEFDVSTGSLEAKFKDDTSLLTLGKMGRPGMPLVRVISLISPGSPAYTGNNDLLMQPFWSAIDVALLTFDRSNRKATIRINARRDPLLVPYLMANGVVDLLNDVFILEGKKPSAFNWARTSAEILTEIGDTPISTPDSNAIAAMGIAPPRGSGTAMITPAAMVLWNAPVLQQVSVIPAAQADAIALYAVTKDDLNQSQQNAVKHAAERALTVIWGPPGTGKTATLSAFLHSVSRDAWTRAQPLKILVTGPTYKAVEELMDRTARFLADDNTTQTAMYFGYSSGKTGSIPVGLPAHVSYQTIPMDETDTNFQQCLGALTNTTSVVIIGCQIQQSRRFAKALNRTFIHPIFDIVVIDESSQVPVSKSLAAMGGLKPDARLIVAGDHLQMPPITSLDAPIDATYMVGSIQTYLMKRSFGTPVQKCTLDENYRSGKDIVGFAKRIGYPSQLSSHYAKTALNFVAPIPLQTSMPTSLVWCDEFPRLLDPVNAVLTLLHADETSSQGNLFEAKLVASLVWLIRKSVSTHLDGRGANKESHRPPSPNEFWGKCIGIVTPHRAQRALVISELEAIFPGEKNLIDEAVDTVERFQGGQRHTILITFGVADTDVIGGEEAFLMQLERTNVAVSRAMAKSIIVMPKTLADYIPEERKTLETAFALKDYLEEYCNNRVDTEIIHGSTKRPAQLRYHA